MTSLLVHLACPERTQIEQDLEQNKIVINKMIPNITYKETFEKHTRNSRIYQTSHCSLVRPFTMTYKVPVNSLDN